MAIIYMRYDERTMGSYVRESKGEGECSWCESDRPHVYTYGWEGGDGAYTGQASGTFCNFACFSAGMIHKVTKRQKESTK